MSHVTIVAQSGGGGGGGIWEYFAGTAPYVISGTGFYINV